MERLWKDIRFALRTFMKAPAFALTAVGSLALGIGVNTTIFTIINALFLNPLPVDRVSEVVAVYTLDANNTSQLGNVLQVSLPNYRDFRDRSQSFSAMAAYSFPIPGSLSTGAEGEQIFLELVTGNYFSTLGVRPLSGRVLGPEDDRVPGASPVIVLGHRTWQRRFGGASDIVGRTVTVNGAAFTVVGVAPEGFRGVNSLFGPDAWAPTMMYRELLPSQFRSWVDERRALAFNVAARLKPGVTIGQAGAEMVTLAKALETEHPAPNKGRTITLRPLTSATIFPGVRDALVLGGSVLMVIVGLVLLIACSNVANLLLARATARSQEIAVRLALGANRSRLVRQLMTENVVLSLIGGALGVVIALWSLRVIWSTRPAFTPQNVVEPSLDGTVLAFTLGVSILTGIIFGLAPAIQASRANVLGALKDNTRSAGRRRRTFGLGNLLIVGQVALSLVALITAALFLRSSQAAARIDPGFDTEHVAVMSVTPGQQGYDQPRAEQFYRDVATAVRAVPGVTGASWGTNLPLFGFVLRSLFVEGKETAPPVLTTTIDVDVSYFTTTDIAFVRGRDFREADRTGPPVAIVNDTMARRYWPGADAIGKRFRFYTESDYREVVGIVETVKYANARRGPAARGVSAAGAGLFRHRRALRAGRGRSRGDHRARAARDSRARSAHAGAEPAGHQGRHLAVALGRESGRGAARRVRRPRARSGLRGSLRRDVVFGRPAHARDRPAHGARRGPADRARARAPSGADARWRGCCARGRGRPGGLASRGDPALREPQRSGELRGGVGCARRRRARREPRASPACQPGRSDHRPSGQLSLSSGTGLVSRPVPQLRALV